jgi:hypothetical protein
MLTVEIKITRDNGTVILHQTANAMFPNGWAAHPDNAPVDGGYMLMGFRYSPNVTEAGL